MHSPMISRKMSIFFHMMYITIILFIIIWKTPVQFQSSLERIPTDSSDILDLPSSPPSVGIATLLTDDGYLLAVSVLYLTTRRLQIQTRVASGYTHHKSNTSRVRVDIAPFYVLAAPKVSAQAQAYLRALGATVIPVSTLSAPPKLLRPGFSRYADTYTKLHVWNITGPAAIVFLDADTLPRMDPTLLAPAISDRAIAATLRHAMGGGPSLPRPDTHPTGRTHTLPPLPVPPSVATTPEAEAARTSLTTLLPAPGPTGARVAVAAAPDCCDLFNPGVLLLRPDPTVFRAFVRARHTTPSYDGGDGGFLNTVFGGWGNAGAQHGLVLVRLPAATNADQQILALSRNRNAMPLDRVAVIHFAGPKPWDPLPPPPRASRPVQPTPPAGPAGGAIAHVSPEAVPIDVVLSERSAEAREAVGRDGLYRVHNEWRRACRLALQSSHVMRAHSDLLAPSGGPICPPEYEI